MNQLHRTCLVALSFVALSLNASVIGLAQHDIGRYHNFCVDVQNHVDQIYSHFSSDQHFVNVVLQTSHLHSGQAIRPLQGEPGHGFR
jgi:hypothetical protein